jgi:hypothetical protein
MDTGSGIYVRLTRYAGSGTSTLSFTNLIVGPGIQPQGAVVSLYSRDTTFTIGASITPPTTGAGAAYFREVIREGSDAIIRWEYYQTGAGSAGSGNYRLPLPTGLTVDLTRYREASDTYRNGYLFSSGFLNTSTSTFSALAAVESVASPTYVTMQLFNDANNNLDWGSTTGSLSSAGTLGLTLTARVPIAEWSGSGTVQLAQNDTEFAFNSSTTTTSDTTSFAYGPAGVAFTAMAPSGVNTIEKRVRFQTPIQTTDAVILEVFNGVNWTQAEQALGAYLTNDAASVGYGQLIRPVSGTTTDVSVLFASAASGQSAWNTLATTGWRWRVRKSSAGAAVGFGIVSSQSAGLLPVSNSNLDDATATRLGLKQYLHGTTYNGGIAPTITLGGGGGTLSSVDLGSFMPYQTQDGTWKLKVSIVVTVSSAVRTLAALDVVGISVGTLQGVYGLTSTSPLTATSYVSNNRFQIDHSSSTTTKYYFSGEVVLSSKPTWAY